MAQVSTTTGAFQELSLQFTAEREGYVLVYTANQTAEDLDVFIDDLLVEHIESPVIRTDDYYPFGLAFNSAQRTGVLTNKYLYQGKEFECDLGIYDFQARGYQPDLGRTWQIDPHADSYLSWSPYSWVANNPISVMDPTGMDIEEKTTKYWTDKDGNEHKKGFLSFKKTTKIERTIKVTDAKIINNIKKDFSTDREATKAEVAEAGAKIKEEIIDTWEGSTTDKKGREISTSVIWEDDVEVVQSEDEINSSDIVFEIGEPRKGYDGDARRGGNRMRLLPSLSYLPAIMQRNNGWDSSTKINTYREGRIASHEFGHMGTLKHSKGRNIMNRYANGMPNFKQMKRVFMNRKKIK